LFMSSRPRQDRARSSDEEDQRIRGISPTGAVLALILVLVFLYAVRWALLPFVISAVAAYIFTPLIQWMTKRTHIPRIFFVCAVFIPLLAVGVTIIVLGAAPLIREATATVADLGDTMERLVRGAIGDRSIEFLGESMNARQVAQAAVAGLRNWIDQAEVIFTLPGWSIAGLFGTFLTCVLLFFFLKDGPRLARGTLWLAPPKHRPTVEFIWYRLHPIPQRHFLGVLLLLVYSNAPAHLCPRPFLRHLPPAV